MDYDRSFKIVARDSGSGLARLAGVDATEWRPVADTLQTTERLADRAFLATAGSESFVVYMEAYTQWVESAPWSLLAKSGLLSERERMPTRAIMFVLTPKGYRDLGGQWRLEAGGEPTQQLWFREVCLWRVEPEEWWEHYPGLMALTPLCRHRGTVGDTVVRAAEAIRYRALDSARRKDLLTTLAIFGTLAEKGLDVFSLIGREEVRDNPLIQEFMRESAVTEARTAVRVVVAAKFGPESAALCDTPLAAVTDIERLHALITRAVTAERFTQVRRALRDAAR